MRKDLLVPVLLISASVCVAGQQMSAIHSDVSRALDGMNSKKRTDREKAFSEMPSLNRVYKQDPAEADRLKVGLIHLLVVENAESTVAVSATEATPGNTTEEGDEEYSDYYGNLIGMVADLNDERAIPALVGAITTGGMATRALARFGDKSVGPLLDRLHDPDNMIRSSVLFTIRDLLEMHISIAPASQLRIRKALRTSLDDADYSVRRSAISAIEYLDNREEFVPTLEKLAQSDPVKLSGTPDDGGDGGQFYPVRQDARRLLHKIAVHVPPVIDRSVNH